MEVISRDRRFQIYEHWEVAKVEAYIEGYAE